MIVVLAYLTNTLVNVIVGLLVALYLGPAEFGQFALALSGAVVVQTLLFDWLRYAAARFYSQRSRAERPQLRATLDVSFIALASLLALASTVAAGIGLRVDLAPGLVGLAVAGSIVNGLFDYRAAMARARFADDLYARLILVKNVLAFVCTAGLAFLFHSAVMALAGVALSMLGSLLLAWRGLADPQAGMHRAERGIARDCLIYALPIVAANALYFAIPLVNRAIAARWYGFAESGQFSLAYDIGTRLIAALGTVLDVLLFQLAVRAESEHGDVRARAQVARNMTIVFAVLAPACVGAWLVLPSIEQLVVPPDYRIFFRHYLTLMLPGLFCWGMTLFAINPMFQIARRTSLLIVAACIATLIDLALLALLPRSDDASNLALAQAGAFLGGALTLLAFAAWQKAQFPELRDVAATMLALFAMVAALWPTQAFAPGIVTAVLQIGLGAGIYGAIIAAADVAGLRGAVREWWRARMVNKH